MSNEYTDAAGLIQFPVQDKEVNGKKIREAVINSLKSGAQIRCTIWDQYAAVPLKQGDFIVVNGKATQNVGTKADGTQTTYNNLSVTKLVVVPAAESVETERTVNTKAPADVNDVF